MAMESPQTVPATDDSRNARGEWRPPYPVRYAPVFVWPPQIGAFLKWLAGYIFSRNLTYFLIPLACWLYLQPALARCVHLQADWVAWIFVRNYALLWLVYGTWYLMLYTLKLQGTQRKYDVRWPAKSSRSFLFGNQVYDNIFWTSVGGLVWSSYEVLFMWACANHWLPNVYVKWSAHPVYGVAWLLAIPFWREFHFYWVHRLIHWKPLYKHVHYLHHKNVNVNPWSGMAMHPVEHLLYFTVVLIHCVVPSHPLHFLYNIQHAAFCPADSHHGFEGPIFKGKVPTGSYFHYLHHRYFECNYGESTLPLDKLFGTFRDGLPDGAGAKLQGEQK